MKRILIVLALVAGIPYTSNAQQGYKKLDIAAGYLLTDQLVAELSYEVGGRYHSAMEVIADYSYNRRSERNNWKVGLGYKPLITRNKNTSLNLRLTTSAGTNEQKFIASVSAGMELNFSFNSGIIFMIRQKNELVFFDQDNWRSGLLAGFKLPLN